LNTQSVELEAIRALTISVAIHPLLTSSTPPQQY
jgi:hypothetical protein